ncbi:MAG: DUF6157 family protein [Bacteroidota bacterium]
MHSTNYFNAFISVAEDCPADTGIVPPLRGGKPSVAGIHLQLILDHPYHYTSDDLIFGTYADRKEIPASERAEAREAFFSKGQACFRASAMGKRYGWGLHFNAEGKVAAYPIESDEYQQFEKDAQLEQRKAMRSKRK